MSEGIFPDVAVHMVSSSEKVTSKVCVMGRFKSSYAATQFDQFDLLSSDIFNNNNVRGQRDQTARMRSLILVFAVRTFAEALFRTT